MPMDPATIIIDLLLTALIYGVGPIAFLLFRKRPLSTRALKTFHISYTVAAALLFAVYNSMANTAVNFSPALVWGLIFYNICKSQYKKRKLLDIEYSEDPKQPEAYAAHGQPDPAETQREETAEPQPEPAAAPKGAAVCRRNFKKRWWSEMIKPKYFIRETAPLIYYKLLRAVLTIGIVLGSFLFIANIAGAFMGKTAWWAVAIQLLCLVLEAVSLNGLVTWEWMGVRCLGIYFTLFLAGQFAENYFLGNLSIASALGIFTGWLIWAIPSYIYFKKRRPLFDPPITAAPADTYTQQEIQVRQFAADESTGEVIKEPTVPVSAAGEQTEVSRAGKRAGKPLKWMAAILAVLLIASIAGNAYQAATYQKEITELKSELKEKEKAVTTLRTGKDQLAKQVQSLKDEIAELEDYNDFATEYAIAGLFMYDSIGFIVQGSRYYHRYDCPVFQDADSYWAHNIEYCAGQGYSRHSACWED